MRIENIKTFARIQAPKRAGLALADSSLSVVEDGRQVSLITDVAKGQSKAVSFDEIFDEASSSTSVYKSLLTSNNGLLSGISCSILRIDESADPSFFSSILDQVSTNLNSDVTMSYSMFTVTDGHCVDMKSFAELEVDDISRIASCPSTELEAVEDLQQIVDEVSKGYSGSCVLLLRFRVTDGPAVYCSTLTIADLCGPGLEKSLALLKNIALSLEQPYAAGAQLPFEQSRLTALLEPYIGGQGTCSVLFGLTNHSAGVETKSLLSTLGLAEALRKVKCHPKAFVEAPEVRELQRLVTVNAELESSQYATRQQVKSLRKDLARVNGEKARLGDSLGWTKAESEVALWEREYKMAQLNLDNLAIQDELRLLEAQLVWMDHQRAKLDADIFESRYKCEQVQHELDQTAASKAERETEYESELAELREYLAKSEKDLAATVAKLEREAKDQSKSADQKASQLETALSHTESNRRKLESDLEETNRKWALDRRHLTEQEKKYTEEVKQAIAKAKRDEEELREQIKELGQDKRKAMSTIEGLEREIGSLKIENATLSAKLDIYTRYNQQQPQYQQPQQQPQQVKSTDNQLKLALAKIEEKLGKERSQMFDMLEAIKTETTKKHEEPIKPKKKEASEQLLKVVRSIPAKRNTPQVKIDEDGLHSGAEEEIEQQPAKTIKLKPKKAPVVPQKPQKENKEPAPQLFVKNDNPDGPTSALKPHSKEPEASTGAVQGSPIKTKSTFIPSASGKQISKPKFLANISFGATSSSSDANRKKIKLPERSIGSTVGPSGDGAAPHTRRNIDPAVYSAIVSNFNVKK